MHPETYEMVYDEPTQSYMASLLMKQGYYNYMYMFEPAGSSAGEFLTEPVEGNFYQTENKYSVYIYYREIGARTDRLIGYTDVYFRP